MNLWLLLPLQMICALGVQRFMVRRYLAQPNPSEEFRTEFLHRLGWVLLASIVAMLVPVVISKDFAVGLPLYLVCAIAIEISQGLIRSKVMKLSMTFKDVATHSARIYAFIFALYGIYYGLFFLPQLLGLSYDDSWIFSFALVFVGLALIKLLSPRLFSLMNGAKELDHPELLERIHLRLAQAGLPKLRVDVWPTKKMKVANALVLGLVRAPKFFQGRIVVTDSLIKDFTPDEVDAIITHEVSHFMQNHLAKRMYLPVVVSFAALMIVVLSTYVIVTSRSQFIVLPAASLAVLPFLFSGLFMIAFFIIPRKLVRNQELDADWMAINTFKVDGLFYFETLNKLVVYGGGSTKKNSPLNWLNANAAHPTNEDRRRIVLESAATSRPPFERAIIRKMGWAGGALMIVCATVSFTVSIERPLKSQDSASVAAPATENLDESPDADAE